MADGWKRLGRRIAAQRAVYGWAAKDLADRARLGVRTVEIIEAGTHSGTPTATTLSKIERALGWQQGSADRVREGGRSRMEHDPLLARVRDVWPALTGDQQVKVVGLVETFLRQR